MGQKYLIDSNSVIDYLGEKLPKRGMSFMHPIIDAVPTISVITKIEVLGFNAPETHQKMLTNFMSDAIVLSLNEEVVDQSINLRKAHKIKLPDAILAATALVYDLTLITRNIMDFKGIKKIRVVNPWEK